MQAFSLALAFGEWDVRKLIREIPYDLFIYWSLFLSMEKAKKTKQDYQFALLTKVICEGIIVYFQELSKSLKEMAIDEAYERRHKLEEEEEKALAQELADSYNKAVDRLRTLIGYTENKLY